MLKVTITLINEDVEKKVWDGSLEEAMIELQYNVWVGRVRAHWAKSGDDDNDNEGMYWVVIVSKGLC